MRAVILSDIHGNIEALQAIAQPWDELWVLGDLVNYGPNPAEVVDFIRRHATVVVRGNHDNAIGSGVDPRCSRAFRETARAMQVYTESVLDDEQKAYLRQLPTAVYRDVDGYRLFLCHAVPSDPLFKYGPSQAAFWMPEAAAVNAGVLLVGHTHLPFILDVGGSRVVNPGSAGQPKHGVAEACYAVWEDGRITLKSTPYAVEATARKLSALPVDAAISAQLAGVLLNGGLAH